MDQCTCVRVWQVWVNDLYSDTQTQRGRRPKFHCAPMEWREKPFDPSTLTELIVPDTPFNLRVPTLTSPTAEVHHASIFMIREANQAGAPADGSDGSWIQAQSAEASGTTSSGVAPNDGLYAND
eukprot:5551104-Pyramimonas_sp.AAC.1